MANGLTIKSIAIKLFCLNYFTFYAHEKPTWKSCFSEEGGWGEEDCMRGMPQQFPEVCGKVIGE